MKTTLSMEKPIATLDKWQDWGDYFMGQVKDHPRQDEFEAEVQLTSKVIKRGEGWIETQNTIYKLGTKA
jgi:hypothetical protein